MASVLIGGTVLLVGCTAKVPGVATAPPTPQPQPVVTRPTPVTPVRHDPLPPEPVKPEPSQPEPPKPAVRWLPRGIGLPLATDDPEAKGKKVAMLTFDDGPSNTDSTAKILDALKEADVKAVFFITGQGLKHREMVERIYKEGHILAPHTVSHANLTKLSPAEIRKEIEPLVTLIEQVTGKKPAYFRPPYGAYNAQVQSVVKELGMDLVNWSDGSLDWDGLDKNGRKDPKLVVDAVMKQLHPGAVILMHDVKSHTAEALPDLIKQIRAQGYELVTLPH